MEEALKTFSFWLFIGMLVFQVITYLIIRSKNNEIASLQKRYQRLLGKLKTQNEAEGRRTKFNFLLSETGGEIQKNTGAPRVIADGAVYTPSGDYRLAFDMFTSDSDVKESIAKEVEAGTPMSITVWEDDELLDLRGEPRLYLPC